MKNPIASKVILLTGGSSGIGLAAARLLMWQGHTVYSLSRRGGSDESYAASGGCIRSLQADVTREETLHAALRQVVEREGRLDVLVCNAGNGMAGAAEDTSDQETRYQFETNFFGVANTIRVCLPALRESRGRVIAVSSVAAVAPIPFQAFYSASKAALLTYMEALRLELAPFGVQCGCVLPGDTRTGFTDARRYASAARGSVYTPYMEKAVGIMERDERGGMPPEAIACSIAGQVNRRRVRVRVVPGFSYQLLCLLMKHLPVRMVVWVVGKVYGL
ncbi:MAG: SDR family oxidoreductase [Paludibacteraceae bacterium]|nr:SDR family oxidoreductase [Paludibacteraceae bacterium]